MIEQAFASIFYMACVHSICGVIAFSIICSERIASASVGCVVQFFIFEFIRRMYFYTLPPFWGGWAGWILFIYYKNTWIWFILWSFFWVQLYPFFIFFSKFLSPLGQKRSKKSFELKKA